MATIPPVDEALNFSNQHDERGKAWDFAAVSAAERALLREFARRHMDAAASEKTLARKRAWKALHDLHPERPMILFEPLTVLGYVKESDLQCENELLRNVERSFRYSLKQYDELGDDIVLEPFFRLAWRVVKSNYGVDIVEHHAENSIGYMSNFPIQTVDDLGKLKERTFRIDRDTTNRLAAMLADIFDDIMPVKIANYDNFFVDPGFNPFCGNNHIGGTMDLFKLMGYDNMLLWAYDEPDALHRVLRYLTDDKKRFYRFLESEGIIAPNSDNQLAGPSSYGYVSLLKQPDAGGATSLKDVWCWLESQETEPVSPDMYNEIYLPYFAEVANLFGLAYYGCCERVDDRIHHTIRAIPGLRTISVSGWSNFERAAEVLGRNHVYSRKPAPVHISGASPNWELAEKDIQDTHAAVTRHGCPTEYIVRDVYDVGGDIGRIRKWVDMTKRIVGI